MQHRYVRIGWGCVLALLLLAARPAAAQERVLTGTITSSDDRKPLPGVSVSLKNTPRGTVSDVDGRYKLSVPETGGVLTFSFVGYTPQEVPLTNQTTLDLELKPDAQQLGEVVVTALGIQRDKKAVGYAVSSISSEKLIQKSESDPVRALTGKIAGVNIQGSGGAVGGSTNITIRGNSSLTGNVQPLFVVDGVPFDNSVNPGGRSGSTDAGNQFTNRAFDLDPNNIASMTVLKGAAAAALYGSRAANGVIVITTKSGSGGSKKGLEVTYNGSYSVEEIARLPDYQNTYGSGQYQTLVSGFIGSFGPAFAELDSVPHIYDQTHLNPILPEYRGKKMPYVAYPNNVRDFLQKGFLAENAIQITQGGEKLSLTGGVSRMNNAGYLPNSGVKRTTVYAGGQAKLDNGMFFNATVNYVNTVQETPSVSPGIAGGESSVVSRLLFIPRMYDLMGLPYEDPVTHANVYYRTDLDNPRWAAKYTKYTSEVNRSFGKVLFGYNLRPWLTVTYQLGYNAYTDRRNTTIQKGSARIPLGRVTLDNLFREELDGNLLLTATKDLTPNLSLRAIVGHNVNQRLQKRQTVEGNGIIVFGLSSLANTSTQRVLEDSRFQQRFQGVFGDVQLSYKDTYFLNVVARNDWSSTLPAGNRSYFYPGANASAILTDAIPVLKNDILNYLKVRAGYARVGNEALPYQTQSVFVTNPELNLAQFPFTTGGTTYNGLTQSDRLGNPALKPEFITELEAGVETRLLRGRVGLDVTVYDKKTTNSIATVSLAPSSGFNSIVTNVGTLRNRGVEIGLDLTPVKTAGGLVWNVYAAFTKNRNTVESLGGGLEQVVVGGRAASNILVVQRPGQPFGQLLGTRMLRDEEGNVLIARNALGRPIVDPNLAIIGDPNPKFILGVTNTVTWKGLNFNFLLDYKHGGQMWSNTALELLGRGVLSLEANGDREGARVIPGVLADPVTYEPLLDGDGRKIPNNIAIANYDWWFTQSFGSTNIREVHVFDASVVRLREIGIGYTVPKTILKGLPVGSLRVTLSGRNLWYLAPNFPRALRFDPETSVGSGSGAQGLDFIGVPSTKRYGVNLTATF